ncbi:MAG: hypothetical protein GKR89_37825 [Candidatus Latescibacteria bacterium]|nr:hypothetical protein [Candidatus Latescibacterota bacterium]
MLTRIEITDSHPVLDGHPFGAAGPYLQLEGRAHFEVDPEHPRNAPIVDIGLAQRNAAGRVECRADIWLLLPADPTLGNGALLNYIPNRGRKGLLSTFNRAAGSNRPRRKEDFGDGFLLEQGYTLSACAWQADVPPEAPDNDHLMTLEVPTIEGITGPVGCEILVDDPVDTHSLGSRYHIPYEVAPGSEQTAQLTVREKPYDPPQPIDRDQWSFTRLDDGRPAIHFAAGFTPGLLYYLVYTGCDPLVMGLGMAAVRDFVTALKYQSPEIQKGALEGSTIQRAYTFGSSQSGRFLRHMLYQGFNQDEDGRQVFDGLQINVAGAGLGSFNHRFAQPSRHASAHFDVFYPTEQFPFADAPQADAQNGAIGGLLDACEASGTTPKIFYINTSTEYWNRSASLVHTDLEARADLAPHPAVRIYHFAGTQHGPADLPTQADPLPGNPVDFRLGHRALLVALDAWVNKGQEPPPSCHGSLAEATLVPAAGAFADLPGLPGPTLHRRPCRLDFGPQWEQGIIDNEPPHLGPEYPTLVPAVDGDGNELAGIRLPEVAAPLGTFTGWRLRTPQQGASWAIVGLSGVWLPFAHTAREAEARGDRRPAITQRYADRADYIHRCGEIARTLTAQGYLLEADLELVAQRAGRMYDWAMEQNA